MIKIDMIKIDMIKIDMIKIDMIKIDEIIEQIWLLMIILTYKVLMNDLKIM